MAFAPTRPNKRGRTLKKGIHFPHFSSEGSRNIDRGKGREKEEEAGKRRGKMKTVDAAPAAAF